MDLYIANCTKQEHMFAYNLVESRGLKMQTIPIGGQQKIAGDLSTPQIDDIVAQHSVYGLVSVDELDRAKHLVPYVYSVGKPVPASIIQKAIAKNNNVLIGQGRKIRQEAAIATNDAIENMTPTLNTLEMSVVEEDTSSSEGKLLAEGIRVVKSGDNSNNDGARRRGRPRKAA